MKDVLEIGEAHSKNLLSNVGEASVQRSKIGAVRWEKFYCSDVYLWRRHGKIPFCAMDVSDIWAHLPLFLDGLPKCMRSKILTHRS